MIQPIEGSDGETVYITDDPSTLCIGNLFDRHDPIVTKKLEEIEFDGATYERRLCPECETLVWLENDPGRDWLQRMIDRLRASVGL